MYRLTAIKKEVLSKCSGSVAMPMRVLDAPSTSPPTINHDTTVVVPPKNLPIITGDPITLK